MGGNVPRQVQLGASRRVGRYEAFLQIGSGGMARVYLAVQRGPLEAKKLVVIKQLRRSVIEDPHALAMFVDEAHIALRLNHPNVVHTYEVVAEPPEFHLAMEFLDGKSLVELLRRVGRPSFPIEEHIWILTQVLAGLHYAHELRDYDGSSLGIVHRDVSPSNVVVCHSGEVKLVDFGVAKAAGALAQTRQGVLKGKLGYAAPEQCLGKPTDARADVYGVGVMLWEALARRRGSNAETRPAMMQARLQDTEPPIEQAWPEVPPVLAEITRRALHADPQQRYESARALQIDLERYLAQCPRSVGPESVRALLRPHFEAERESLHRAIDAYLGNSSMSQSVAAARMPSLLDRSSGAGAVSGSSPLDVPVLRPSSYDLEDESDISSLPISARLLPSQPRAPRFERSSRHAPPSPPQRRPLAAWALVAAVVIGGAALAWTKLRPEPVAAVDAPSSPAAPAAAGVVAPGPAQAAGQGTTPSAGQITVRIAANPKHAVIHLDGKRLTGNPYIGQWPRDGLEHALEVRADDHQTEHRSLRFDANLDVELTLDEARASRPARGRFVRGTPARAPAPRAPAPARPAPEAPRSAPEPAPSVDFGADLRSGASDRVKRGIDDKDPYAP